MSSGDLGDNCGGDGTELAFGALEKEGKEEEEELRKLLGPGKAATVWFVCTQASLDSSTALVTVSPVHNCHSNCMYEHMYT